MQPEKILNALTPVVLAGGAGSRLRPLTGHDRPKPFLRPFGPHSLLQETLLRARDLAPPMIVAHRDHGAKAREEAVAAGITPRAVLHEPLSMGTAAALGCAAYALLRDQGEKAFMMAMPSDHYIAQPQSFMSTLRAAAPYMARGEMVLITAPARTPDPRYGYVSVQSLDPDGGPYRLRGFVEKPSTERARSLLREGMSFWNTGIFACSARVFWDALQQSAPATARACARAMESAASAKGDIYPQLGFYAKIPPQVVDRAVMEQLSGAFVMPLHTSWQDIGCWSALLRVKMERLMRAHPARSLEQAA